MFPLQSGVGVSAQLAAIDYVKPVAKWIRCVGVFGGTTLVLLRRWRTKIEAMHGA